MVFRFCSGSSFLEDTLVEQERERIGLIVDSVLLECGAARQVLPADKEHALAVLFSLAWRMHCRNGRMMYFLDALWHMCPHSAEEETDHARRMREHGKPAAQSDAPETTKDVMHACALFPRPYREVYLALQRRVALIR